MTERIRDLGDDKQPPPPPPPEGLVQKFRVERIDPEAQARHASCELFVLDPAHDRHAATALLVYAWSVQPENPQLAGDLFALLTRAGLAGGDSRG